MKEHDDDDDELGVTEIWDGHGSWTGPVEVFVSRSDTADATLTLPRSAVMSTSLDGSAVDVAVPLALIRWVAARSGAALEGHSEGSSS